MTTTIPTPAPVPDPLSSDFGTKAYDFTVWMSQAAPAMTALGNEINIALNQSLLGVTSSSTTSLTIPTPPASRTITVGTGLGYAVGMPLKIPSTANVNNYMKGVVTAYNSGTGSLTVNVLSVGGSGTFADWAVFFDIPDAAAPKMLTRNITSADTIVASDAGKLLTLSGTFTLSAAATTLGAGFYCFIRADSGTVTFDPNGSETVDGVTSGVLKGGYLLQSDGVGFTTVRLGGATTIQVLTSGTSWPVPLGVRIVKYRGCGGGGGTATGSSRYQGSAGGYFEGFTTVSPGASVAYAIGAAGSTTSPCTGGTTTWNSVASADGGTTANSSVAAGGAATGGTINIAGGGTSISGNDSQYGIGGSNPLGMGGTANSSHGSVNATGYGSGAATYTAAGSKSGQSGVIILEY